MHVPKLSLDDKLQKPSATFVPDSGDSGRIDYDEKAVLSLLDRTSSHDDAPDEEKDIMANEYLASFKVRRKNGHI